MVILKKGSISILNIKTSPASPGSWALTQAIHQIGNLAPKGYVSFHDMLFVCAYDGIYLLSPNNLAESDATPTELLRVSEPINDIYLALSETQRAAIKGMHDPKKSEVLFSFGDAATELELDYMEYSSDGNAQAAYVATNAVEMQVYSEATIKQQGSYSLKIISLTNGNYVEKAVSPVKNLAGKSQISIQAIRTAISVGNSDHRLDIFDDIGGWIIQEDINLVDTSWATKVFDLSGVDDENKSNISKIRITRTAPIGASFLYVDNLVYFDTQVFYAYSLISKGWRQIESGNDISILTRDENDNVMGMGSTDKKVYAFNKKESVEIAVASKVFNISVDTPDVIRHLIVTYKSESALTAEIYVENNNVTPVVTVTLPVNTAFTTIKAAIKYRANKFKVRIIDDTASITDTQISQIEII